MLDSIQSRREQRRSHTWRTLAAHAAGAVLALLVGASVAASVILTLAQVTP